MMLRFVLTGLFTMVFCWVQGQQRQLLYGFSEIPQSLLLNPAEQLDYSWYAGVPMLSSVVVQGASSGVSVHDIFADDGADINDKIREHMLQGMSAKDDFSATTHIEILHGGFRASHDPSLFFSFGLYNELDAISYWMKDLAILGIEGNANYLRKAFNMGDLNTRGEMLNVFHIGASKKLNSKWSVGGRAKLYSSIFNFKSTQNEGTFTTDPGEDNLLRSTLEADMELQSSGLKEIYDILDDDSQSNSKALAKLGLKRGLLGGDLGVGLDLGFTYNPTAQTRWSASLVDLGFVYHFTNTQNYTFTGEVVTEGVEVILPGALLDPDDDYWQDLIDYVEDNIDYGDNSQNYIAMRPLKVYTSLSHSWGEPKEKQDCDCDYRTMAHRGAPQYANTVGGLAYTIIRPRGLQPALAGFYQRRFGRALSLKASYTVDRYTWSNLGLGMNLRVGPVNFYVLADNLLGYQNLAASQYTSLQIGLNVISWGNN